ncbi:MAG: PqqD family protein [Dysgonamonadaceae bacterium]|jgi:hypothetical protein|nr:PqqD family protein [Dysgonamonadaceae bacterium]
MRIKEDLILRRIGDEYIVIVPNKGSVDLTEVYTLNETSAWIWEQLKEKDYTLDEIVELVRQYYDINREMAMNDVRALVDVLREGGLITED